VGPARIRGFSDDWFGWLGRGSETSPPPVLGHPRRSRSRFHRNLLTSMNRRSPGIRRIHQKGYESRTRSDQSSINHNHNFKHACGGSRRAASGQAGIKGHSFGIPLVVKSVRHMHLSLLPPQAKKLTPRPARSRCIAPAVTRTVELHCAGIDAVASLRRR
jgi:hypothetical protein